jgi:2-dehydro-3-deoxyphosphogluconate aldolase/(4S)-4-hydroxy-2-oxoglutarate aldolase
MLNHDELLERAFVDRLVAIIRLRHDTPLARVAEALVAGGIRALEFTLTSPGAVPAITECRARFGDDVIVGAGTVLDAEEARRCLDAGAQFLVSPGFDPTVVAMARERGALALPGALTPTEIVTAWRAGADVVKVFPARTFGPRYIADLRAPLPQVPLMPTGGVDETNVAAYLRAGAVGVAVGGRLVAEDAVARADWDALTERARVLVAAVRQVADQP